MSGQFDLIGVPRLMTGEKPPAAQNGGSGVKERATLTTDSDVDAGRL